MSEYVPGNSKIDVFFILQTTIFWAFYTNPILLGSERSYTEAEFNASTAKTILYYTSMHEHLDFEFGFGHQVPIVPKVTNIDLHIPFCM
jgi:hypothetical protein